jgi:hypothetical protein
MGVSMPFKLSTVLIASLVLAGSVGAVIAWRFAFFLLPFCVDRRICPVGGVVAPTTWRHGG